MDYILSGNPKEVQKVLKENRIRVERGVIKFTPFQPEKVVEEPTAPIGGDDEKVDEPIVDTKAPIGGDDEKKPKTSKRTKK